MQLHRGIELALVAIITVFAIMVAGAYATDYFVAKTGDNSDGLTWGTAWNTVQGGIGSCSGVSADVVKVAQGTYVENVVLKSFVTLEGGWDATTNTRDHEKNVTTINGGAAGPAVTIFTYKEYVTIDGFTITNGNAASGGGICCYDHSSENSTVIITNNTITGNYASADGGGISCYTYSSPIIRDNTITDNSCPSGYGGGISCYTYSSPTIQDNTITDNSGSYGGGISCYNYSSPAITNCLITHNESSIYNGGGIQCYTYSSPTLVNCTIANNTAFSTGGALYVYDEYCKPTLVNCILWGDSPDEIAGSASYVAVTYSDVQGGRAGTANITGDPLFTNGLLGDYYLSCTGAGQGSNSPCIDAGSDTSSNLGLDQRTTRTDNVGDTGTVDMGYHYGSGEVEPTIFVSPDTYDFGYELVGVCVPAHFTLSNDGNATLSVLDVISSAPEIFEVTFSTPATLGAGATMSVVIAFCPAAQADYTGTVTFVSNDPDGDFVVHLWGTAVLADISVTPDTYNFGYGVVGACVPGDFTLANNGHGDLVVSNVISSDPAIFEVTLTTPLTIGRGAIVPIVIAFCPAEPIDYEGTVTFVSNDPDGDFVVHVSGTAAASDVSFEPANATNGHDFGAVRLSHTVEWTFVMKNATSATAQFDFDFATDLPFAVLPTTGTLEIGSATTVTVTFHPTDLGAVTGTLVLSSPNPDFSASILFDLSGLGAAPDIQTITEHQFPDTPKHGHSDYSFDVANIATGATAVLLNIANIVSNAADFTIVGVTNATIAAGEAKSFTMRFSPSAIGTISGVITVYSDDPDSPAWEIHVSGVGLEAPYMQFPNLEAVADDFGTLRVGEVTTGTLEIYNAGDANLEITNMAITENAESFSLGAGIATQWTIEPGDSLFVDISFHPVEIGATTGVLTILSNDPVEPACEITLTGIGKAAPNVVVNPTSLDFGTLFVGDSAQLTFTISNTSRLVPLSLTGVTSNRPDYVVTIGVSLPAAIPTASSIEASVEFTPSATGTITGAVTVTTDDPETPNVQVSLFGTGYDDLIPPGAITDLEAHTGTATTAAVMLSWTAPADDATDATSGPCVSYDIRYSDTGPINTTGEFEDATPFDTSDIIPATPGTLQFKEFSMPEESVEYWFAMTSTDDRGNVSLLSNTAHATSLAVELSWFKASAGDGRVVLTWQTASEMQNLGFYLMRSIDQNGHFSRLSRELIEGAGTTVEPQFYSYTDENVRNAQTYYYYLVAVQFSGVEQRSGLVAATPFEGSWAVSVDVSTNKSQFLPGDKLVITVGASNRGETVLVDARIWVTLPSGRNFELLSVDRAFIDGGVAVIADFVNYTFSQRDAAGEYVITCMITDSENGSIMSYSVTSFVLTSRASVLPPSVWRSNLRPSESAATRLDVSRDDTFITK